jgi:AcrR family transcriptional regulator
MNSDLNAFKTRCSADLQPVPSHRVSAMRSTKGEQTRAAIAEAALRMFREHGYEATTMRAIAKEVGVATGNAYYYFDSKEELIQEYYARNQADHAAACRPVLDTGAPPAGRAAGPGRRADPVSRVRGEAVQARGRARQPTEPVQQGVLPDPERRDRAVRRGDRRGADPGADRPAEPAA